MHRCLSWFNGRQANLLFFPIAVTSLNFSNTMFQNHWDFLGLTSRWHQMTVQWKGSQTLLTTFKCWKARLKKKHQATLQKDITFAKCSTTNLFTEKLHSNTNLCSHAVLKSHLICALTLGALIKVRLFSHWRAMKLSDHGLWRTLYSFISPLCLI